jgi:precorrin-6B methylase 2
MAVKKWRPAQFRSESSYWRSCILITAADLNLFSWIGAQEKTPRAVAGRFGGSPTIWEIFLNALCGMKLLRKRGAKYANTFFSLHYLARGAASLLLPDYDAWDDWGKLGSLLRGGRKPKVHKPFFSNRKAAARLLHALQIDAEQIAPQLIKKLPLRRSKTLLDVGGGLGAFTVAFCRRYPRLQATLVEHPRVAPLARRALKDAGMKKRVMVLALDFSRQALPRNFDSVFVSNVLHSHGPDQNRSLLAKIHDCLNPGGQLILRDVFMSHDRVAPEWATLFSVLLLLQTPQGRCYALAEVRGWLRQAGFAKLKGPFRSSSLFFDPDSILIATKS